MFSRIYLGRSVSTDLDKGIDVYAFAITIWQLMTRQAVWRSCKNSAEIEARVNKGDRPKFYKETIDSFPMPDLGTLVQTVQVCWSHDVSKRPTMNSVCDKLERILRSHEKNVETETTIHKEHQ